MYLQNIKVKCYIVYCIEEINPIEKLSAVMINPRCFEIKKTKVGEKDTTVQIESENRKIYHGRQYSDIVINNETHHYIIRDNAAAGRRYYPIQKNPLDILDSDFKLHFGRKIHLLGRQKCYTTFIGWIAAFSGLLLLVQTILISKKPDNTDSDAIKGTGYAAAGLGFAAAIGLLAPKLFMRCFSRKICLDCGSCLTTTIDTITCHQPNGRFREVACDVMNSGYNSYESDRLARHLEEFDESRQLLAISNYHGIPIPGFKESLKDTNDIIIEMDITDTSPEHYKPELDDLDTKPVMNFEEFRNRLNGLNDQLKVQKQRLESKMKVVEENSNLVTQLNNFNAEADKVMNNIKSALNQNTSPSFPESVTGLQQVQWSSTVEEEEKDASSADPGKSLGLAKH